MVRASSFVALALAASLSAFTSGANASTLDLLGSGSTGTITYKGTGSGLTVSSDTLAGSSFFLGSLGTWSLSPIGPMTSGPENNQGQFTFTSGNTDTLSVTIGGSSLTCAVTWTTITDGTLTPRWNGSFVITAITGANFISNFGPVGSLAFIDMTTNIGTLLSLLQTTTNTTTSAGISSGELVPTPLPGALPLFAGGLAGLWALGRKRKKQKLEAAAA